MPPTKQHKNSSIARSRLDIFMTVR